MTTNKYQNAKKKLAVNFDKTKIVVFSKQKLNKGTMNFYYGPNSIEIVETYKYLGIVFQESLFWKIFTSDV